MPTALIIGGRGQSGLAIAQRLRDDGWQVVGTASGPPPDPAVVPGIRWVLRTGGDLASTLDEAGAGPVDAAVHTTAFTAADAEALMGLGDRIGSAVVLSTLSVYTDASGRSLDTADTPDRFPEWPVPIPEDQPLLSPAGQTYSHQKVAVEEALRQRAPWPVTIVRPGAIHGRYSRHLREWYFIKRALDGRPAVVLPFGGRSVFQPTATTNMAELVRLAAARPGDRALNAADLDPPSAADISAAVEELMSWRPQHVLVVGPEPAPTVGNHPWAVPRPVVADMRRARDDLGYEQPVSYREALEDTVRWAVDAARGRDWKDVFPTLGRYPDLFDYAAEDAYLAGGAGGQQR